MLTKNKIIIKKVIQGICQQEENHPECWELKARLKMLRAKMILKKLLPTFLWNFPRLKENNFNWYRRVLQNNWQADKSIQRHIRKIKSYNRVINYIFGIFAIHTFYYGNRCINNAILFTEYFCEIINAKK